MAARTLESSLLRSSLPLLPPAGLAPPPAARSLPPSAGLPPPPAAGMRGGTAGSALSSRCSFCGDTQQLSVNAASCSRGACFVIFTNMRDNLQARCLKI